MFKTSSAGKALAQPPSPILRFVVNNPNNVNVRIGLMTLDSFQLERAEIVEPFHRNMLFSARSPWTSDIISGAFTKLCYSKHLQQANNAVAKRAISSALVPLKNAIFARKNGFSR